MKPKLKIVFLGSATYVELAGKTIGKGVKAVAFQHERDNATLNLTINLKDFAFMPDGYIDQVEKKAAETNPPEGDFPGRTV